MPSCFLRLWMLVWGTVLLCGASAVRAQTPSPTPAPLQMSLGSPVALTEKPLRVSGRSGKWVPIAVTLSNTGEPVAGQLQLQLSTGSQGNSFEYAPNTVSTQVEMPTNSRKVIWLYARLDRPDVGGFEVTYSGRGFGALKATAPVQQPDPEQRTVMIISDTDDGLDDTLRGLRAQALFRGGKAPNNNFSAGQKPVLPFAFDSKRIPDRWIGFESADMVVLGDFVHASLAPQQLDALRGYVHGGGTLVVLGGANAQRLASSPLKDLWPVVPTSSVAATSGEVAGLVRHYVTNPQNGGDRLGGAPVVVTRGTLAPNAVLADGSPAAPLLASEDTGAGRVLFLSYDPSQPPFKGWSGQGKLWSELFLEKARVNGLETVDQGFTSYSTGNFSNGGYSPPPSSYSDEGGAPASATGRLLDALAKAPQLRMPPVSRIAWFLALYVFFLVPVNYAVLRLIDRRELAWVTIPVIVVAFSLWAYSEALSIRGRAILTRQMDVVQSSVGSTSGRVDTLFWLFSPRRTTYDIQSGGQKAALADYAYKAGGEQGSFRIEQPADGSSFGIEAAPLRMWTDRAFASQSLGDLKRGINFQGRALQNGLGVDLYGAVWVQDKRVVSLGPIKQGATVAVPALTQKQQRFGADISGAIVRASKLSDVFDQSAIANNIPQNALTAALGDGFGKLSHTPMLVAWGRKSVAPFSIGLEAAQGREMTLFLFRAPKKLPATFAAREATVQRVAFEPFSPGQSPSQGGFEVFDCQVPDSGTLTLNARGIGVSAYMAEQYRVRQISTTTPLASIVRVEAWDAKQLKWQLVTGQMQVDSSPAGGWNFRARIPAAWVRRPANTLRVRVRRDNAGAQVSSLAVES